MIGPITTYGSVTSQSHYFRKSVYKTSPGDRRVPMPYIFSEVEQTHFGIDVMKAVNNTQYYYACDGGYGRGSGSIQELEYTSWKRLVAKIGPRVNVSLNLIESASTIQLVGNLMKAVRHPLETVAGYIKKAARKARQPSDSIAIRDVPSAYLAYKFGVEPLVKDIYSGVELLASDPPLETKLGASARRSRLYSVVKGNYDWSHSETYTIAVRRGCVVTVDNPNVFLLAQSGLINPASVAFDAYPLSFVLNWLWPIGTYLSSVSDFAGLSVKNAYISRVCKFDGTSTYKQPSKKDWFGHTGKGVFFKRELGIGTLAFPKHLKLGLNIGQITSLGALSLQWLSKMKLDAKKIG